MHDVLASPSKGRAARDPGSEVSRLIASREYKQLLPEEGTKPSVYYLV